MVKQIHLDQTLKEIVTASKLRLEDSTEREKVIKKLRDVVAGSWVLGGSSVEAYGSFVSHLSTRWGDLDMSINLPNRLSGMTNIEALRKLENDFRCLPAQDEWHITERPYNANVPILKLLYQGNRNISCDVSVNNWSAQVKSKLLLLISQMDERFHDMVLLVKEWAQAKDINDPKPGRGTFNSYCLTLLVIYHFQTCVPPILPPLEHIYCKSVDDVLIELGVSANGAMQIICEECAKNIATWKSSNRFRQINNSSLSDLFISFMEKFSDLCESAAINRICTSTKTRYSVPAASRQTYNHRPALHVVDPFEASENVARTVEMKSRSKISEAFKSTYDIIVKSSQQLSAEQLLEELSMHVTSVPQSPTSCTSPLVFVGDNLLVEPQYPGLRYTTGSSSSTNQSTYPARPYQSIVEYGFKGMTTGTGTRREMYSDEEVETTSTSQTTTSSRSVLSWAMLGIGSLALAGTALYSLTHDPPPTNHDDDPDNKAATQNYITRY